jgi:hypothetical protein
LRKDLRDRRKEKIEMNAKDLIFTQWPSLNQSPASMVKSPAEGGKGTGM